MAVVSANGCRDYCGNNGKCIRECEAAISVNRTQEYKDYTIGTKFVAQIETATEVTGSDSYGKIGSRLTCFCTRDGQIYYLFPGSITGNLSQPELLLLWTAPESMALDTRNNKGLYSIAFAREKAPVLSLYIAYASKTVENREYDHTLCVAQLSFNIIAKILSFVEVIFTLPQKSNFRSGGFMSMGLSNYEVEAIPIWISSGGNEYDDIELMREQPRYSSISAVWAKERVRYPGLAGEYIQENIQPILWANGIYNPLQCDYSPVLDSRVMHCLTEVKGIDGQVESIIVANYEKGHTVNEKSAEIFQAWGSTSVLKSHAEQFMFYVDSDCLPSSIYYSTAQAIGKRYLNKVIIAQPSCQNERFPPVRLSALLRNFVTMEREYRTIEIDFLAPYMVDTEIIGSELNRGMYLAGRNLRNNKFEIYLLYDREEEMKQAARELRQAEKKKKK